MKEIKVFGPGCTRCETTAQMVRDEAAKLGQGVSVTKITDMAEIAMAGVMSTPGIMIDGKLVHTGGLPKEDDLSQWLQA